MHKTGDAELNERLVIEALDEPSEGGASHSYIISYESGVCRILFQRGPLGEAGNNGISMEALLAIVADRLLAFQRGPFHCHENELAIHHLHYALEALKDRTRARLKCRGNARAMSDKLPSVVEPNKERIL